ncbi:hypothetical protein [Rugosimonospora africana]|uniref:Uncharacterized protein n=1 Tax=Rugosimonospora africana TaxID=556532 RepID=A0A8J3QN79_9ACTN|nr:hypothetical protein [Rugosimonospora africana]GIH13082.1 hypothetical protein Raf01_12540 [Rugosimonospora africana]
MIKKMQEMGITSSIAYTAGVASIAMSIASWAVSKKAERAGVDRADRWGIYVGLWAPTFFGIGNALKLEETHSR